MTITFPRARQSIYELSENLRTESIRLAVRTAAPSEAEREELVLEKLGVKAWGRLHHFRHYYSQGWGEGTGRPLSPRALEAFHRFVQTAAFPGNRKPSVFLTDAGNLELCWEDGDGKSVQVEFTPAGVEFFIEASGVEGEVPHSEIAELARQIAG